VRARPGLMRGRHAGRSSQEETVPGQAWPCPRPARYAPGCAAPTAPRSETAPTCGRGPPWRRLSCRPFRSRQDRRDAVADVEAHITGTVWKIECEVGDTIEEGDTVVILESMKMEMPVEAEDAGVVREILCEEGQAV